MRNTRIKKHCSMSKSRCGIGALIGSLVVNVTIWPFVIGKCVLTWKKGVSSVSGTSSILVGSVAISSSLGVSDFWGVHWNIALKLYGSSSSLSGSKVNLPRAQPVWASGESVIMLWRALIWVFEVEISVSRWPKMSCWSWSFRSSPQNISKTFQISSVAFCCVFPRLYGKIWAPWQSPTFLAVIMQQPSRLFVWRLISNLLFEYGEKIDESWEQYPCNEGGISGSQAWTVGLCGVVPRTTAPLIDSFLASATELQQLVLAEPKEFYCCWGIWRREMAKCM